MSLLFAAVLLAPQLYGACAGASITYDAVEGRVSFDFGNEVEIAPLGAMALQEAFPVSVQQGGEPIQIQGGYQQGPEGVIFSPRFPFLAGVGRYSAEIRWDRLIEYGVECPRGAARTTSLAFQPGDLGPLEATEVVSLYPRATEIPENILRFYVTFSQPMARGSLSGLVRIEGADGTDVEAFFLDNSQPLWNGDRTRLTLLLNPGRIKRGVGPNAKLGPALNEGETYRLIVDSSIKDAKGHALAGGFTHTFMVTAPVHRVLHIDGLDTSGIVAGTKDTLKLSFPQLMDVNQLRRLLVVTTGTGEPVAGSIQPADQPYTLLFTPDRPWREERYALEISSYVEDISGNTFLAAFDESSDARDASAEDAVQVKTLMVIPAP